MNGKPGTKKAATLLALAIFLLVTLACGSSKDPALVVTSAPSTDSEEVAQAPTAIPQQIYKIGDVIQFDDRVLIVLGWENVPADENVVPDEGQKFVAVELIIVNDSSSAASIAPLWQMSLKDDTAQKYNVNIKASIAMDSASLRGELAPGEKVRGKVGFQVPQNAQGLQFIFDANAFVTGKAIVNFGAEPITVAPPANIAGETLQETYHVGDVIALGTTRLTINEVSYPAGDQAIKPDPGNKFLVVDLTIENQSAEAISISTLLQMSLKDADSQKYEIDLMAAMASGGNSPDGELAPGEKLRGQVGFQVPENGSGYVFVFEVDLWSTGKIFVALP